MKKIFSLFAVLGLSLVIVACGPKVEPVVEDDPTQEANLTVAVNFDGKRFISSNQDTFIGADGVEVKKGDLLPTWREISKNLNVKFTDLAFQKKEKNTDDQFQALKTNGFTEANLVNSQGANITREAIENKSFVNLLPFIEQGKMPNLKKFLDSNATFMPNLKAEDGGIYYTPYLDGYREVENMFLIRHDWTRTVIDGTAAGDSFAIDAAKAGIYKADNPETLDIKVDVTRNNAKTQITKKYSANIITTLNAIVNPTGAKYLAAFRTHMQSVYGNQGYAKLSDVFLGTDAAYDADELIALMRVVRWNPSLFNTTRTTAEAFSQTKLPEVFFPREAKGNRVRNMFRSLEMFGVRGALSKNNWLYLDSEGKLIDSRTESTTIDAINNLNDLYKEGIILENSATGTANHRDTLLKKADGFLMYDFNATQTSDGLINAAKNVDQNYQFEAILPPVVQWKQGQWFHFTESVRLLKNEAWGITSATTGINLARAVTLLDYIYAEEDVKFGEKTIEAGAPLHLFGPSAWRSATKDYDYNGTKIYSMSAAARTQMGTKSMIDYLRDYVGATLPIGHVRSLGLEVQTLSTQGRAGYDRINAAINAGTYRLQGITSQNDKWYQTVPNVFPLSNEQESDLKLPMANFTKYWGDNDLGSIMYQGIRGERKVAYDALFIHSEANWYTKLFIPYYTQAYKINNK